MPIYDLICPKCKKEKHDVFQPYYYEQPFCEDCSTRMERKPSLMMPDVFPAEGIFFEHVSPEGKRFYSKEEVKRYAKEHDIEFDYLS